MTLKRSPFWRRGSKELRTRTPLAQISAKRLAKLATQGITNPGSTLVDKRKPLKAVRSKPAVPLGTKDALKVRAGEWCEVQLSGCYGKGTDPSHRITTKAGGRHGEAKEDHDRLSDVLWACRYCHDWIGKHPAAAKAEFVGWALEEWQEPTEWPALYRGQLRFLDDAGNVHDYERGVA
jgi:hypothetical protein